ncbi:MAG: HDOD domain-containing protein, partial [Oleibacter sp.]|nr:HDOD domain-containing protein [Thalassolituus sp.]
FWQQAVVTATLCNELARTIATNKRPDVGLAYLCGLLHNFGYLILGHVFPPQFELVNRYIEANPHIGRHQLEMYLLGITREQCAAALLKQWGMPAELIIATRYQHHEHLNMSNDDANLKYAQLLYVATRLLRQRGFGDGPNQAIDANVWQALGLDEVLAQSITDETLNRLEDLNVQVSVLNQATSR